MKLHQVLTGAANVFDDYVAVSSGLKDGHPFITLASGYDVVILDKDFQRVQIIPLPLEKATSIVRCLACSNDGKIAASYGEKVVIYNAHYCSKSKESKLPYNWEISECIADTDDVRRLCWDRDGKKLLIGRQDIQLWKSLYVTVDGDADHKSSYMTCVWMRRMPLPIRFLEFSPDGHYFASAGLDDRMVKIWYHSSKVEQATWRGKSRRASEKAAESEIYNFVYILHPKVVTGLSWRKTGLHMPPYCVPNILLTSCADNVSRLWTETVKLKPQHHQHSTSFKSISRSSSEEVRKTPGATSASEVTKNQPSHGNEHEVYHGHHLLSMFHFHLSAVINPVSDIALLSTIPTSSIFGRSFQLQWLDNKEIMFTSAMEELLNPDKANLTGTEDEESHCLSMETDDFAVLEDLDLDGDMEISREVENSGSPTGQPTEGDSEDYERESNSEGRSSSSLPSASSSPALNKKSEDISGKRPKSTVANKINQLLHDWCKTGDTLFCIHPADGSLLIWLIDYLDDYSNAYYRQCQVSFASRIPNAFSKADAASLYWTRTYHVSFLGNRIVSKITGSQQSCARKKSIFETDAGKIFGSAGKGSSSSQPDAYLLSAHSDGSINSWQLVFSDGLAFTGIASITHMRRNCGPRFETTLLVTHPTLPLTISTSKNNLAPNTPRSGKAGKNVGSSLILEDCASELILWRSSFIGPLSRLGGVTETARISSTDKNIFNVVAWFPLLFKQSLVKISGVNGSLLLPATPCAVFVAANGESLKLYQVILDAKMFLSYLTAQKQSSGPFVSTEALADFIASEQSGSNSSCILEVCDLDGLLKGLTVDFLHVFNKNSIHLNDKGTGCFDEDPDHFHRASYVCDETCFIVAVVRKEAPLDKHGAHEVLIWKVALKTNEEPQQSPSSFTSESTTSPLSPTKSSKFKDLIVTTPLVDHRLVVRQSLPLPCGVTAEKFSAATDVATTLGHNSTCPAPYWFSVSCSDRVIRFFKCVATTESGVTDFSIKEYGMEINTVCRLEEKVAKVLALSNATPYRLAWLAECARGHERSLKLVISESESSGGEKWLDEFSIDLGRRVDFKESDCVLLTWMSLETDYHLLTLAFGGSLYLYHHEYHEKLPEIPTATLSSVAIPQWEVLSSVDLCHGSSRKCKMTSLAWAWGGMLLVGVKNELRVYSQWEGEEKQRATIGSKEGIDRKDQEVDDDSIYQSAFQRAANSVACLPQYHPKHLIEMLNLGKTRRVKAILSHVVRCVAGREAADAAAEAGDVIRGRTRTMSRSMSILSSSPPDGRGGVGDTAEAFGDDYAIPPLPLHALFAADNDESANVEENSEEAEEAEDKEETVDYYTLFDRRPTLGSFSSVDESATNATQGTGMSKSAVYFGLAQSHLLAQHLSRIQLPGLSRMDQLYLLALSDTVASTKNDLEGNSVQERGIQFARRPTRTDENLSNWGGGGGYATSGSIGATVGSGGDAVDECGLKFLLAMRHHTSLQKSLPPMQKNALNFKGLPSAKFAWAFHSDCEEELLAMIPGMLRGEPTWRELKQHGVVWWITSTDTLRRMAEKLAKVQFQANQNPLDCAIIYLAMKKKSLLAGLYRSLRDSKMSNFFSNDFSEERWRKAAMKNAYALLGMQRFEHAAAFFLLANAFWDAVKICITHLNDLQLALLIARLFEGSDETGYRRILAEHVLGGGSEEPNPDPFLRSIAYWRLKNYDQALETLLLDPCASVDKTSRETKFNQMAASGHPDIFNYYVYLRTHPVLRRRHFQRHETLSDINRFRNNEVSFRSLSKSTDRNVSSSRFTNEVVTPRERNLYFRTACTHLNAGMPDLALEVLTLLPKELEKEEGYEQDDDTGAVNELLAAKNADEANKTEDMIITGTLQEGSSFASINGKLDSVHDVDWSKPVSDQTDWSKPVRSGDIDWGAPVSTQTASSFDWSQLVSEKAESFDSSAPISTSFVVMDGDAETTDSGLAPKTFANGDLTPMDTDADEEDEDHSKEEGDLPSTSMPRRRDIVALHLKYIAILKCLLEELRSLPTKCQVEKTKLRPTVSDLLEKEVALLHQLCDFNSIEGVESSFGLQDTSEEVSQSSVPVARDATQDIQPDRFTLAQKAEKVTKKIQWLSRNQRILTTLYNCCSTQGVGGENVPAICLELLLLLHELEHHHVLSAPLRAFSAGSSAPPLLLASIATFSLVASPVSYLQSITHDILRSLHLLPSLPLPSNPAPSLGALESLALSLSSCLYHSLCGGHDDHIIEGIRRGELTLLGKMNKEGKMIKIVPSALADGVDKFLTDPSSLPSSWPGVHYLRTILAGINRDGSTNLKILLCEAAVAIYISLLVSAASRGMVNLMYRLVQNCPGGSMWDKVFGGGINVVLSISGGRERQGSVCSSSPQIEDKKRFDTARMKWNYRLLGKRATLPSGNEAIALQQELFIAPVLTLYDFFQRKPTTAPYGTAEYDSDDSEVSSDEEGEESDPEFDDDFDSGDKRKRPQEPKDHLDWSSYSWLLMRFGLLKVAFNSIQSFVMAAGVELSDLPAQSPLLYSTLKTLVKWQQLVMVKLDGMPDPPADYIPVYYSTMGDGVARGGVTLQRFKALLDPANSPFRSTSYKAFPSKRLWQALVHQECLKQSFLYYAFGRTADVVEHDHTDFPSGNKPRIIYRDQEPISCFSFNGANFNTLALATSREIVEIDLTPLVSQDVLSLRDEIAAVGRPGSTISTDVDDDTLLVSRHGESMAAPNIMMKKNQAGIRRMDAHPHLPYYITGAGDGSVKLWEFGHQEQITLYRAPGVHDRVTRVHFNSLGNKFGVTDDSGYLGLWLMSNTSTPTPYLTLKCHSRQALDFAFVGSSSLVATAGYSSEGRNICLWDTLLPSRKSLIHAFSHHEHGAQSILYLPGQQCILSGGRKGHVCIFDVRQRRLLHTFTAHDAAIKSLALDPREEVFASGFADGDIKIWGLRVHELYNTFPKEHAKNAYLRNMSTGVQSLAIVSNCQLFSCGSDGTLKWRSFGMDDVGS